jgi:hypothetical protein
MAEAAGRSGLARLSRSGFAALRSTWASASGSRGAFRRSTMLAARTWSLVALNASTARRINSLMLTPSTSAVAEIARFCAGVTKKTMRSLGLFMVGSQVSFRSASGPVMSMVRRRFDCAASLAAP